MSAGQSITPTPIANQYGSPDEVQCGIEVVWCPDTDGGGSVVGDCWEVGSRGCPTYAVDQLTGAIVDLRLSPN